jgi:hypothetical protein
MSRGQRSGSPTVVNLSFLDRGQRTASSANLMTAILSVGAVASDSFFE